MSIIQVVYLMSGLFFSEMYLNNLWWWFFLLSFSCSCFLSYANSSQKEEELLLLSKCSFLFCVFLSSVDTVVSTLMCPLSELQPKLNPTVRLSCVFVKDSRENSRITTPKANNVTCHTQQQWPWWSKGYSHASLPGRSQNLSLLLLWTLGLTPIFLSSEKLTIKNKKNKKKP